MPQQRAPDHQESTIARGERINNVVKAGETLTHVQGIDFFRPLLTAIPVSVVVVAVTPVSMVIAPSPMSWGPAVISASIPIPRSMDVIRPIVTADGDLHRLNGRYQHSAQTKQSCKKQH